MGELRNIYRILLGKFRGKNHLLADVQFPMSVPSDIEVVRSE
jgi:hypothetical protein